MKYLADTLYRLIALPVHDSSLPPVNKFIQPLASKTVIQSYNLLVYRM